MSQRPADRPITVEEAYCARIKNIVELGIDFSVMTRVFEHRSYDKIAKRLEQFLAILDAVAQKADYERLHENFCTWFTATICTAKKQLKNGETKPSYPCSYGQAAKVVDVAAKAYVYYCGLPSPDAAQRLLPHLHAALDTEMMAALGVEKTLQQIDRPQYEDLQRCVARVIEGSNVYPVQYDDVIWRRLARGDC